MPPKARRAKVPEATWDVYKEEIKKLYLVDGYTLNSVADEMNGRLNASPSQFEAQLKAWGIRKNLTAQEWKFIFDVTDNLPLGTQSRIIISGHQASASKIQRARQKYKSSPSGISKRHCSRHDSEDDRVQKISDMKDVSIQIQINGTWVMLSSAHQGGPIDLHQNAGSYSSLNTSSYDGFAPGHEEYYMSNPQHNQSILDSRLESGNLNAEESVIHGNSGIIEENMEILNPTSRVVNAISTATLVENLNPSLNWNEPFQLANDTFEEFDSYIESSGLMNSSDQMSSFNLSVQGMNNSGMDWEAYVFPTSNDSLPVESFTPYGTPGRIMGGAETQTQSRESGTKQRSASSELSESKVLRVLYCVHDNQTGVRFHQTRLQNIRTDKELFLFLRVLYYRHRNLLSWLRLRTVSKVMLNKIEVDLSLFTQIHDNERICALDKCICLLPADRIGHEYSYQPTTKELPTKVPMYGDDYLIHFFKRPQCLDEKRKSIFQQLTKCTYGALHVADEQQTAVGWGFHFEEGWDWEAIYVFLNFLLILAVTGIEVNGDVKEGFANPISWLVIANLISTLYRTIAVMGGLGKYLLTYVIVVVAVIFLTP
ncbi:hypothetical protein F4821DRAFT_248375 [Hypoxylon rubiginosum]|uniref:Uncharacterized protein n=1 Tax=Hypoxylon rubiginosum TaxID=110542 RepID=A0ACC0CN71_9PEZI|nr:hypothetical protein F4821DRAFT_248375 [Hypoxylon rubiginosum]